MTRSSWMNHRTRIRALCATAALLSACMAELGDGVPPEELGYGEDAIVGGIVTYERPEVGSISGCTATLVTRDVIITAAHCLGYRSALTEGNYGTFTISRAAGDAQRYRIIRYRSYSTNLGRDDIALMQLGAPVPSSIAAPAGLARVEPPDGAALTLYGYGCTSRGTTTDWRKRKYVFRQGQASNRLCPGDSGGPVLTESGEVLRINSGYWGDSFGTDIFGSVPRNHDRLVTQIREWSAYPIGDGSPAPAPPPAPEPAPDPLCAPRTDCGSCAATAGCGWCGATGRCVPVDRAGAPVTACTSGFALDTPQCTFTDCGIYAGVTEFTCRQTRTSFVRCRAGATPEFLICPSGYTCSPGSRTLMCYR